MGEHEGWQQPPSGNRIMPNGLVPSVADMVIQELDTERWAKAEERTTELIARIQPNLPSEERRNAVADYVQRLIMKCFPCQVFTFGSVPLKTYLPDGDIDLTAFSKNQNLKDTWAHQVRDILESEEKNDDAEFRVKEVQYIQAEVKIIKCLVENIVVDISFNQLGGLCTLCFLEEVDHLINQNHLFKRSIILIKAWCYYESRILGAHHGLISTYALETLVLYIFHVFNSSFAGPLEVLYRFLEFFSKFDWDNFCVSLWGPVRISSLPNVTAEPPRKDGGELLLSKLFLDACSSVYSAWPPQENQGQPFVSKHFNVIDPLRVNNNLGRSVSKGNFFRIRSAFAFGARRLARLLECPKEDICYEVSQFFSNTWKRHGSGCRPDAPSSDLYCSRLSNSDPLSASEKLNKSNSKEEISSACESQVDGMRGLDGIPPQLGKFPVESSSKSSDAVPNLRAKGQKSSGSISNSRTSDIHRRESGSTQGAHIDKSRRTSKPDPSVNDVKGRFLFARTRSSPELTDSYNEVPSQGMHNRVPESGNTRVVSTKLDSGRRKNLESDVNASHCSRSITNGPASVRSSSSRQSLESAADLNSVSNTYCDDLGSGSMGEGASSGLATRGLPPEEQDPVNMMVSSATHGFNGQVNMPLNLASGNLPLQLSPSFIASMEYAQRTLSGMVPTDLNLFGNPWAANMQYPHGLAPTPLGHYFPGMGFTSNSEDLIEPGNENFGSMDVNSGEADPEYWHEQERGARDEYDQDNGVYEMHQSDDREQSTSAVYNFGLSRVGSAGSSGRTPKSSTDFGGLGDDDCKDSFHHQERVGSEVHHDDRAASSRSFPAGHSGSSLRSKTPSESSWEGSPGKVTRPTRDRRARKPAQSSMTSNVYGKGKSVPGHSSNQGDDDNNDWNLPTPRGTELTERGTEHQMMSSLHASRHQMGGPEFEQTGGSDSVLLSPGSRERVADNSGVMPFAFYPTGPPVPFVAMLPLYNFPHEAGNADIRLSRMTGEEGVANNDSGQNFDASEGLDQPEVSSTSSSITRVATTEPDEQKSDILNGDFASHWQNLQYGRFCQNSGYPAPPLYPSPMMAPPVYLQGRSPWDGPGRPLAANSNLFTQLMGYGPRLVPVAPLQSVSSRPAGLYQHYVEEMPRYRSGTGTYLPNPKAAARDRHSTSSRRGNYSYDRSDHHGDREGNWNVSKSRAANRSHNRNQGEKPSSRPDRISPSDSRAERPWSSQRRESHPPFHSQNGPIRGPANVAYGMYPLPAMDPNGISSNGPNVQSFVMLYPYNHNSAYGSSAEQLEFGSFGPVGFSGLGDVSPPSEGARGSGTFEEQSHHRSSAQQSSTYQP